jgi:hypothetical protein
MRYRRRNELPDPAEAREPRQRLLEPIERVSEVLFGLIMVLTFTGSLSAAESGRAEVKTMLIGALGCNIAWGLIDAIMYLMDRMAERASKLRTVAAIRQARTDAEAVKVIVEALPPVVASALDSGELKKIQAELLRMPETSMQARLEAADWLAAIAVFLFVFASTMPVIVPFLFLDDAVVALRISNAIAVTMMFVLGYIFGQLSGYRPLVSATAMVLVGSVVVTLTIALGG